MEGPDNEDKITSRARNVQLRMALVMLSSFEPILLYEVLGKKGFVHKTEADGETYKPVFCTNVITALDIIRHVNLELVWEPGWTPAMMTDYAKEELGYR